MTFPASISTRIVLGLIVAGLLLLVVDKCSRKRDADARTDATVSRLKANHAFVRDSAVKSILAPILDSLARENSELMRKYIQANQKATLTENENVLLKIRLDSMRRTRPARPRF